MDTISTSVIGLGMMGSALARALIGAGYDVTVFNRSSLKSTPFQGSAQVASSVEEACRISEVIFVCVVNYEVSDALLHTPEVEAALAGKLVVQLTTGTPASARDGAAWAARCGTRYLEGVINVFPPLIGTAESEVIYSGPRELFDHYLPVLKALGGQPKFYSEQIGPYAAINLAGVALMAGCHAVLYHSLAMLESESVPLGDLEPNTMFLDWFVEHAMQGVGTASYPSGNGSIKIWRDANEDVRRYVGEVGVDPTFISFLLASLRRSIELGHGDDDLPALYESFRPRASTSSDSHVRD